MKQEKYQKKFTNLQFDRLRHEGSRNLVFLPPEILQKLWARWFSVTRNLCIPGARNGGSDLMARCRFYFPYDDRKFSKNFLLKNNKKFCLFIALQNFAAPIKSEPPLREPRIPWLLLPRVRTAQNKTHRIFGIRKTSCGTIDGRWATPT